MINRYFGGVFRSEWLVQALYFGSFFDMIVAALLCTSEYLETLSIDDLTGVQNFLGSWS